MIVRKRVTQMIKDFGARVAVLRAVGMEPENVDLVGVGL